MNTNANLDINKLIEDMENDPTVLAAVLVMLAIFAVLVVLYVVGRWKTVKKLGGQGWSQVIPVYGEWVISKSAGCETALCVAFTVLRGIVLVSQVVNVQALKSFAGLFSLGSLVVGILVAYKVACRFGKGKGFTFGLVVLPVVFYPILGIGSATPVDANEE